MTHTSSPRRDRNTTYGVISPERDRLPFFASPYDPDAQTAINAIQSTGVTLSPTQKQACSDRITAFKLQNIWDRLIAYYGFLGGTAASHAINWRSPGTYNITWNGTVYHSAQGVVSGGGYGDTGYNLSTGAFGTNGHLSAYSRTNSADDGPAIGALEYYGSGASPSYRNFGLFVRYSNNVWYYEVAQASSQVGDSNSLGSYLATHDSTKKVSFIKNGSLVSEQIVTQSVDVSLMNANLWVLNRSNAGSNVPSGFYITSSLKEYGSISFGKDLTQSQAIAFSATEQEYQTALGRAV